MRTFVPLRLSIFAALGVAGLTGCESNVTDGDGGGGAGGGPTACVDPQPIEIEGVASGFVRCEDGSIDRIAQAACEDPLPHGTSCIGDEENAACTTDADCVDQPHGRCTSYTDDFEGGTYCGCSYGCATDDDCGDGRVCVCGGTHPELGSSHCVSASCATAEDCDSGACGLAVYDDGCGAVPRVSCRTTQDQCRSESDCAADEDCSPTTTDPAGPYACQPNFDCAIGRPMTIEGQARVAPRAVRGDWRSPSVASDSRHEPALRAALAERWTTIAGFEHASVGSFARFTMQLLALGAPADLLAETQRAAADEVEHARLAYGLASAFAGRPIGPGPLEGVGAVVPTTENEVVRGLVAEACIGETLGVAEALATADACADAAIKRTLTRIAADEQRHAELAWRTLAWMLARNPSLAPEVTAAVDSVQQLFVEGVDVVVDREAGLLSSREIVAIRRRAFEEVVQPCLAAVTGA